VTFSEIVTLPVDFHAMPSSRCLDGVTYFRHRSCFFSSIRTSRLQGNPAEFAGSITINATSQLIWDTLLLRMQEFTRRKV
jgi:hypothetical protein